MACCLPLPRIQPPLYHCSGQKIEPIIFFFLEKSNFFIYFDHKIHIKHPWNPKIYLNKKKTLKTVQKYKIILKKVLLFTSIYFSKLDEDSK